MKNHLLKCIYADGNNISFNAFLDAVNPKYVVISFGKDNDYGHSNA